MAMNEMRMPRAVDASTPAQGSEGFSLLEVMTALVLLAIGLLGVAAAQLYSLRFAADSDNRSQAAYLAEEQLGTILSMSNADPELSKTGPQDDPNNPIVLADLAQNANPAGVGETTAFSRSWVIEQSPVPGLPTGMRRVTVTVTWNSQRDLRAVQLVGVR